MSARTLILLSCSRDKLCGGSRFDNTTRRLSSRTSLTNYSELLSRKREQIFDLLKGKTDRLYNEDQGGGYRDERGVNQALTHDPYELAYMPAYERYDGRFFTAMRKVSPQFWSKLPKEVEILFVSGLYGLLFWDEPIQNYDCHLNDYIEGRARRQTLGDLWRKLSLTAVLCDFMNADRKRGRPFTHVFDMLSEETYQNVFDWELVCSKGGVKVQHRIFRPLTGTDTLPYMAEILATQLS
jgi:cytoplasmic iron level regulating protein YaaA (DUF328/UPF0246 family)